MHVIRYPDPHALSGLIADLHHKWYADNGITTDRLLVESFLMIDPTRTLAAGLVPLWTMFPVESAVQTTLDHSRSALGRYHSVHVGLFPHGVESRGIAEPDRWRTALRGLDLQFMGVDTRRYPADFAALVRYGAALRQMPRVAAPRPGTLGIDVALAALERGTRGARSAGHNGTG